MIAMTHWEVGGRFSSCQGSSPPELSLCKGNVRITVLDDDDVVNHRMASFLNPLLRVRVTLHGDSESFCCLYNLSVLDFIERFYWISSSVSCARMRIANAMQLNADKSNERRP